MEMEGKEVRGEGTRGNGGKSSHTYFLQINGESNGAISGSIKSMMAAVRHLGNFEGISAMSYPSNLYEIVKSFSGI